MTSTMMRATKPTSDSAALRQALGRWYRVNGRHALDWRLTRDPYAVLVSEIMLQQTQVERVLPYYRSWLARWPDAAALAGAPTAEVIRLWSGLGYNRRAVQLQRAAATALERHGAIPTGYDSLIALPGVGPYTAAAVACFAAGARIPVVDTNIARVVARHQMGVDTHRAVLAARLSEVAEALLPARGARDHNLALMDLGALVCRSRGPACDACPLVRTCLWRRAGAPSTPRPASTALPFEATARFARGRIVEALRQASAPLTSFELCEALPSEHRERLAAYLSGLQGDGLVECVGGAWALPGHGRMSMASPNE
ncbi:MAG TPA: A/G-specific adenine glycosylase [Tepidiformaceae bacterium]|nr:A/G-specific adenine glycosylase [Tepidiformaceae bacterium]